MSKQNDGKNRIVRFWYNVEDTLVFDEQIGRRRKRRRSRKFAIDANLFPFWQWRHALKSQSVGHKRTLSP